MPALYPEYWPQFFTATILEWKTLLQDDKYKEDTIKSHRLWWLVKGNTEISMPKLFIFNKL